MISLKEEVIRTQTCTKRRPYEERRCPSVSKEERPQKETVVSTL